MQCDKIEEPSSKTTVEKGRKGTNWSVPNSTAKSRDDTDKSKRPFFDPECRLWQCNTSLAPASTGCSASAPPPASRRAADSAFRFALADGKTCIVYDVVFHPKCLRLALLDESFKSMLVTTALSGIEQRFPDHKLKRDALAFPKMKFKVCRAPDFLCARTRCSRGGCLGAKHCATCSGRACP